MPKQRYHDKSYKIVPEGKKKPHELYGSFPHDDGLRKAEEYLEYFQDQYPKTSLIIIEE